MNNLKRELANLNLHLDCLCIQEETFPTKELKREILNTLRSIREIKSKILDCYISLLHEKYNADALYEDRIISEVGEDIFIHLHAKGKIQCCGCISGRRLYTF